MISQIIGYIALWLITRSGGGMDVYYEQVVLLTGLTGILSMIPCLWFYSRDRIARKHGGLVLPQKPWKLDLPEMLLLLGMGAAFSQYANMLVGILQSVLNYQESQETMDQMTAGKSMWFLLICMGVIAPLAEELVFAYFLEISGCLWSSVLLHMGANIWSLVSPDLVSWMLQKNPMYILIILSALILTLLYGISYFRTRMHGRTKRVL